MTEQCYITIQALMSDGLLAIASLLGITIIGIAGAWIAGERYGIKNTDREYILKQIINVKGD